MQGLLTNRLLYLPRSLYNFLSLYQNLFYLSRRFYKIMKNYNEKITEYLRVKKLYFSIQADKPFKRKQFFCFSIIYAHTKRVMRGRLTVKERQRNGEKKTEKAERVKGESKKVLKTKREN